jgi:hypothetical protein
MKLTIITISIILFFVALTIYGYVIAHGYSSNDQQYCGFGERDNCINIIPQNEPIAVSQFQNLDEVFNNE